MLDSADTADTTRDTTRHGPKTVAERCRDYRERKKAAKATMVEFQGDTASEPVALEPVVQAETGSVDDKKPEPRPTYRKGGHGHLQRWRASAAVIRVPGSRRWAKPSAGT